MKSITELIKHYSLPDFREGKTDLQIKNYQKEIFENQEIGFNAILREVNIMLDYIMIVLEIPNLRERESVDLVDGLYYSTSAFESVRVYIHYPLLNDPLKIASFSKNEKVYVTGLITDLDVTTFSMNLLSINRIDRIEERPNYIRRNIIEGDGFEGSANKRRLEERQLELDESKSKSCFIATACYGDYNSEEVLFLRKFRDNVLQKSFVGNIFVKIYYFVSPPIAKIIKKSSFLKTFIRNWLLSPIIHALKKR